jgi:integrase
MKTRINRRAIDAMQPPEMGQGWLYDTSLPGFLVLCQASGRKSYVVRYKAPTGAWRKLTIALCSEMEPDTARAEARRLLEAARLGRDPAEERRAAREAPTLADLQRRFMAEHAAKLKPGTSRNYEILWRRHILPRIGDTARVVELKRQEVQRLHDTMRATPHNANRALEVLHKALELAEVWGWREQGTNPAEHVAAYPEQHRQRTLTDAEMRRLWSVLDRIEAEGQPVPFTTVVRLLLLTGCRLGEWLGARWNWIDFERGLLCLPDSKTGARDVHLPAEAMDILRSLPRTSVYILPGEKGGPIGGMQRAWRRIPKAAGLDDVRLHDLRHTVGSLGHRAGLNQRQIADLLGHKQMATTARYINSADEHKREAVTAWAGEVRRITSFSTSDDTRLSAIKSNLS